MASVMKPSSRYSSYDSRSSTSSHFSDPSSSSEFNHKPYVPPSSATSRALAKAKPSDLARTRTKSKVDPSLTTMVKKLMEKKSMAKPKAATKTGLVIPSDLIAQDLKKDARRVGGFSALQKKLFGKGGSAEKERKEVKALTEVKGNTRTLAMVLRSERELMSMNKEQEMEIVELKLMLEEKNKEVEKLKDLCLKQREEIKSLKSAILFPDVMNSQLQELLEKQGCELKQAKQVIPALQKQVTSLTGQLQNLADDLAEVKAEKYSAKASLQGYVNSSPRTPKHAPGDASNSWDFSSEDLGTPCEGSVDDLLLKDLNPCLTPHNAKSRSRDFEAMGSGSLHDEGLSEDDVQVHPEMGFSCHDRKLSKSSDCCQNSGARNMTNKAGRRSDESKLSSGSRMSHRHFITNPNPPF